MPDHTGTSRGLGLEETDFGQSRFGHPDLTNPFLANSFGCETAFGQIVWEESGWNLKGCGPDPEKVEP